MQPFYILHPRFEWQVWQRIQDNMAEPIQKNPPSSGLLGMNRKINTWTKIKTRLIILNYCRDDDEVKGTVQNL